MPPGGSSAEDRQRDQLGGGGRRGAHGRDDRGIGQDPAGRDVAPPGHAVPQLPQGADPRELAARAEPVDAARAPPRVQPGAGRGREPDRLELLVGPGQLALAGQRSFELVAQLEEHFDVERGVDEPGGRQRAGRPVGRRVALLQPQAEDLLDHGAEAHPREAGQAPGELGVEDRGRHKADLGEAGEVLTGGVQHPLVALQHLAEQRQVRAGDRVDQGAARPLAAQLHEVGALAVAVARRSLGVDRDRPGTGGEAGHHLGERGGRLDNRRDAVARNEQRRHLRLLAGHFSLRTRQGRRHQARVRRGRPPSRLRLAAAPRRGRTCPSAQQRSVSG